jgi:Carbohydrate binding domain
MRLREAALMVLFLAGARFVDAQEAKIDVSRFELAVNDGAQASATVNNNGPEGQPAVTAVISGIGLEFWSVELRAPNVNFEPGKVYDIKFQAKCAPPDYVYVVPEKIEGNQSSVAAGTTLHLSDQWAEYSVQFQTTEAASPGRLTLSGLSANPVSYSFSNVRVSEK